MLNRLSGESLADGRYVIGTRPSAVDGRPLFVIEIRAGELVFTGGPPAAEVFTEPLKFILHSGDWCTASEQHNPDNLSHYLIVPAEEYR